MKTKKIIVGMLLGLIAVPAISQNVETKADSLQQVVDEISEKNKQLEAETLNKKIWNDRAKYFNISYVKQNLSEEGRMDWNSQFGVALTNGKTYYLHKKPILGMIKFGLDWSYFDINMALSEDNSGRFSNEFVGSLGDAMNGSFDEFLNGDSEENGGPVKMYQAEIGMQFGPSVTVNPINHLKINGYFRVTPSFSMLYAGDEFFGNYGTFFSSGGAISYKVISFGVEARWGKSKYKEIMNLGDDEEEEGGVDNGNSVWKTNSTRFYVSFRF